MTSFILIRSFNYAKNAIDVPSLTYMSESRKARLLIMSLPFHDLDLLDIQLEKPSKLNIWSSYNPTKTSLIKLLANNI